MLKRNARLNGPYRNPLVHVGLMITKKLAFAKNPLFLNDKVFFNIILQIPVASYE